MKTFFEFLYYNIFLWYSNNKNTGPDGSSSFAVSGLQVFNVLSIIMLYSVISYSRVEISKLYGIILYLILAIVNYFQYVYFDKKQIAIKDKWDNKPEESKRIYKQLCIIYIVVSFLTFFGLVGYYASKSG